MGESRVLSIELIVSNPGIRGDRPIIDGTTLRVQDVVIGFIHKGYSVDELIVQYPQLTHAQIHAALAYYYAHRQEIDHQIEADEQFHAQAKADEPGQRHPPVLR
jgi:uncharacterized protein (DUF433 family)